MSRTALFSLAALLMIGSAQANEWYESLWPGISRQQVQTLAGLKPDSSTNTDVYKLSKGRIECVYDNGDILQNATYYDPPDGTETSLYSIFGEGDDSDSINAYIQAGNFTLLKVFRSIFVNTELYNGRCYPVDTKYFVIEPIIALLGGSGFYADKSARVLTVEHDGTEKILYQAMDHWKDLKPPGITDQVVKARTVQLLKLGSDASKKDITKFLGPADSRMGSGVDYRLYYLEDGLLVWSGRIVIDKPGDKILSFEEWLNLHKDDK